MKKIFILLVSLSGFYTLSYGQGSNDLINRWDKARAKHKNEVNLNLELRDEGSFQLTSKKAFSVFINRQLSVSNVQSINWNIDSLKAIRNFPITISVFSKAGIENVSLRGETHDSSFTNANSLHKKNAILLGSIIIAWMIVFLVYTNAPTLREYLNIKSLFTLRMGDDSALSQRVTSLNNVLIYIFCSLLISLCALAINPGMERNCLTLWEIGLDIIQLITFILTFFLAKIVLTSITSKIFALNEYAPTQFYTFIKILLTGFIIIVLILVFRFIFQIGSTISQQGLITYLLILFGLYLIITFLRLNSKHEATVFHLFSYLCVSEIFPALILLRIF